VNSTVGELVIVFMESIALKLVFALETAKANNRESSENAFLKFIVISFLFSFLLSLHVGRNVRPIL
jgi:hypothetical protein